ncbi:hypothetical protein OEZ85_003998 [Tetradesmus obliquus]|uniref:TsaA-like domain-containing protein n=1 Tax=Tetradesmus obliquus TaxID=3088 RepID=A0ABY8UCZ6_TETOB|nr:hypothetical protein OEZ85_003998 [Tetradesmus obliquus]
MTAADGYRDVAVAAGVAAALAVAARQYFVARRAAQEIQQLQSSLAREQQNRGADRAGRIRAEQQLKQLHLQLAAAAAGSRGLQQHEPAELHLQGQHAANGACEGAGSSGAAAAAAAKVPELSVFPFTAIGTLKSCFTSRTGTPRQPHLVPAARAVLRLAPGIPPTCLRGLQQFSHCWVLYVFHENTDLAKLLAARAGSSSSSSKHALHSAGIKSHVKVPRLNGGKMGVLATRTPHRPVPIGLSTAQVIEVDAAAGVLVLGGVDIVDGSPVLDVKPYVPFSDALPGATAPDWVAAEAGDEPLALSGVDISAAAAQQLAAAWRAARRSALCPSAQHFMQLVEQVLARDISESGRVLVRGACAAS